MPIEIRELIIKTRVEENTSKNASPSNPSPTGGKGAASTDAQEIIDKVMDILKSKKRTLMEKVQIRAFTDTELTKEVTKKPLLLPVNPESFNRTLKVELKEEQGQGSQGSNPEYVLTLPEELSFEFVFDGTGTIEGYAFADPNDKSVKKQLEIFLATVYNMDGDIHKPYYLKVQWGQLIFPCMLSNLDLNYNLFLDNGDPLRVKANATFKQYISLKKRSLDEGKKSPDLTHVRSVKAGDRLDLMTNKIYNDSKYVAQIAKANGLTTIRKIKPGKDLVFPPLDKTEQN